MEVMERTGARIRHPEALDLLDDVGARVIDDIVRIPDWVVKDALRKAPSRIALGKRNGERLVRLERNISWFGASLDYLEPFTGERRRFLLEDCRKTASLLDALPNYEWGMTFGLADDVPAEFADRLVMKTAMTHSEKPMVFCCKDVESLEQIYEMAVIMAGGEKNSNLFDRSDQATWLEQGGRRFQERLREQTLQNMKHRTEPLADEKHRALGKMAKHLQLKGIELSPG